MTLDAQTRRNLELTESSRGEKRHSSDRGARSDPHADGRALAPALARATVARRQRDRSAARSRSSASRRRPRRAPPCGSRSAAIGDLERLINRAVTGIATPRDLGQLRASLKHCPKSAGSREADPALGGDARLRTAVVDLLDRALVDEPPALLGKGEAIRPGFSPELDGHQVRAREAREWIANLERTERERTGIRTLKVGYNKVFGYYLEVTAAALANAEREQRRSVLPTDYIPKQTLANATRYFTPELKEYRNRRAHRAGDTRGAGERRLQADR